MYKADVVCFNAMYMPEFVDTPANSFLLFKWQPRIGYKVQHNDVTVAVTLFLKIVSTGELQQCYL